LVRRRFQERQEITMAIKNLRQHVDSRIDFFMNEVAERGGVVSLSTAGSGMAVDQSAAVVTYAAAPSGTYAVGFLMCDMVNNDLTRVHENWHKNEMQINSKCEIWTKGFITTNMIYPGVTIVAGDRAYAAHSGLLHRVDVIGGNLLVGRFDSTKDEDGYAKVSFNLP
jgi:hypothetical protein